MLRRRFAGAAVAVALLLLPGCAGSTYDSGVRPEELRFPPYYSGWPAPLQGCAAHVAVAAEDVSWLEDDEATALLLARINAHLDSLGHSVRLHPAAPEPPFPPQVSFELAEPGIHDSPGPMRLQAYSPTDDWKAWVADELAGAGADALLLIEFGHTWLLPAGDVVRLGSEHEQRLPRGTDEDEPLMALVLRGALVGADGRVRRIGAEGIVAAVQESTLGRLLGMGRSISRRDVRQLLETRRTDLPGEPLRWQVALETLVRELTGAAGTCGGAT